MIKELKNPYSHIHNVGNYAGSRPVFMGMRHNGEAMMTYGWLPLTKVLNKGDIIFFVEVRREMFAYYGLNGKLISGPKESLKIRATEDVVSDIRGRALIKTYPKILSRNEEPDYFTVNRRPSKGERLRILGKSGQQYVVTLELPGMS